MIPHGTITGHAAGCKSDVTCPMTYVGERSCKEVYKLFVGDYQFRKQILAGMTPAEILAAEKVAEAEAKAAAIAMKEAARFRPSKAPKEPKPRRVAKHGTESRYTGGCRDECPGGDGGLTCRDAANVNSRRRYAEKKATREAAKG